MDSQDLSLNRLENNVENLKESFHSLDKTLAVISDKLSEHYEQDSKNLEKITEAIKLNQEQLGVYNSQLKEHMARTVALENQNSLLEERNKIEKQNLELRLKAIEAPYQWLKGTSKIIMWLGIAAAAVMSIIEILVRLRK